MPNYPRCGKRLPQLRQAESDMKSVGPQKVHGQSLVTGGRSPALKNRAHPRARVVSGPTIYKGSIAHRILGREVDVCYSIIYVIRLETNGPVAAVLPTPPTIICLGGINSCSGRALPLGMDSRGRPIVGYTLSTLTCQHKIEITRYRHHRSIGS